NISFAAVIWQGSAEKENNDITWLLRVMSHSHLQYIMPAVSYTGFSVLCERLACLFVIGDYIHAPAAHVCNNSSDIQLNQRQSPHGRSENCYPVHGKCSVRFRCFCCLVLTCQPMKAGVTGLLTNRADFDR